MADSPRRGPAIAVTDRAMSAAASAIVVVGIGLAPDGLLLAGAGLMLALIAWERFKRSHARAIAAMREAHASDDPEQRARTRRLTRVSTLAIIGAGLSAGLALGVVQGTGEWAYALMPATVALLVDWWGTGRMRAALAPFAG